MFLLFSGPPCDYRCTLRYIRCGHNLARSNDTRYPRGNHTCERVEFKSFFQFFSLWTKSFVHLLLYFDIIRGSADIWKLQFKTCLSDSEECL